MQEELLVSKVPRALEMKTKLMGFELADLLLIFANLAVTNMFFGTTELRYPLVWGTTGVLAFLLFYTKRGKPDNYLQHLGEFMAKPSYYAAGSTDLQYRPLRKETHT